MIEHWDIPLETMLASAALRPFVEPRRGWLCDPPYCPLACGFLMANDWDGHFFACLRERAIGVWFSGRG